MLRKSSGGLAGTMARSHWQSTQRKNLTDCGNRLALSTRSANFRSDLNLNDVEEVFRRLGRHYGTEPLAIDSKKKLDGLRESARIINQFSSLALTTTESLAYVYENTLISKETRDRKS